MAIGIAECGKSPTSFSVLGLDLSGSERRPTGCAYLDRKVVKTRVLYKDEHILELAGDFDYIFIDAPLSLPKDRKTVEDRTGRHLRECDVKLKELGIRFFPITLGPMRMLTERGIRLSSTLKGSGKQVYEVFPGAFYDVFGVKRKDKEAIKSLFRKLGFSLQKEENTQDELDAVACLITGLFYLLGRTVVLGGEDGSIIIPKALQL
ncbi:MAG: DUF429 domain-containing protein [Aquificaceae bacterium]